MRHPNLKRTLIAAVTSLLVAGLMLVGTAPVSSQSKSNGQGIPQQIAALEQQVKTLSDLLRPGAGGGKLLRVVDGTPTTPKEVGLMFSKTEVAMQIGGFWRVLYVGPNGFTEFAFFYNDQPDCSGNRYMPDSPELLSQAWFLNGIAYYGNGDPLTVEVKANQTLFAGGGSSCESFVSPGLRVLRVATADLSGFKPPFKVQSDQ